jgi:hypothetical protein
VTKGRESGSFTASGTGRFGSAVADRSGLRLGFCGDALSLATPFFVRFVVDFLEIFLTVTAPPFSLLMLTLSCGACAQRHRLFSHQFVE